jgi:hypothetical protein
MSNPNKSAASEPFNEPVTTGGANTNDWVASMRGMMLMYADGNSTRAQSETSNRRDDWKLKNLELEPRPR